MRIFQELLRKDFEGIYAFSWSPEGKNIAFSSNYNVYIQEIVPDGTDQ
jgi:hypothetical protein